MYLMCSLACVSLINVLVRTDYDFSSGYYLGFSNLD